MKRFCLKSSITFETEIREMSSEKKGLKYLFKRPLETFWWNDDSDFTDSR